MVHLKKGADGHLLKNAAGHLVKHTCYGCGVCDDAPCCYTIILSGLSGPGDDCCAAVGQSTKTFGGPPAANGTYYLNSTAACRWELIIPGNYGTLRVYSDEEDCTGAYTEYDIDTLEFLLRRIGDVYYLNVRYGSDGGPNVHAFAGTKAMAVGDCGNTVIDNDCVNYCDSPAGGVPCRNKDGIATMTAG